MALFPPIAAELFKGPRSSPAPEAYMRRSAPPETGGKRAPTPLRKLECDLESAVWRAYGPESEIVVPAALFTIASRRSVIPCLMRRLALDLAQ